jgi:uncharacterized membrane protein
MSLNSEQFIVGKDIAAEFEANYTPGNFIHYLLLLMLIYISLILWLVGRSRRRRVECGDIGHQRQKAEKEKEKEGESR